MTESVEPLRRAPQSAVFFHSAGIRGGEIENERPSPDAEFRGGHKTVKMLGVEDMAIHSPHQAVEHAARPVRTRKIVCDRKGGEVFSHLADLVGDDGGQRGFPRPFGEPSHSLGKGGPGRSLTAVPQPFDDLVTNLSEPPFRPVPHADEHMEEASDQRDAGKKPPPCVPGRPRPVGVDGFRARPHSDT